MKQFWIIVSLISLSLFTTNCTKEDWTPDSAELSADILPPTATIDDTLSQFLTYDYLSSLNEALIPIPSLRSGTTVDSLVEDAMLALEGLDAQHGFIKNIVRKYGYPIWDRVHKNYDSRRETVLFVPLAFAESTEVTAFFVVIPWKDAYRFRLVKKDQIVQAVEGKGKYKDWENLTFVVMEFFQLDLSLFDFIRNDFYSYLVDLSGQQGGAPGAQSGLRSCTTIAVEMCVDIPQAIVQGVEFCSTYYEEVCDSSPTGGGDSSCQECTGSSGDGGSSSGGSSGGSGGESIGGLIEEYDPSTWPIMFLDDGVHVFFETCLKSFQPVKIGEAHYVQVDKIWHRYVNDQLGHLEYQIPTLCIGMSARSEDGGYRSFDDTKAVLKYAFDGARKRVMLLFNDGVITNSTQMRDEYIRSVESYLSRAIGYRWTEASMQDCNVPHSDYMNATLWESTCENFWPNKR